MRESPFDILPMSLDDLPKVLQIEKASFPIPFSEALFRMELNLNMAHLYIAKSENRLIVGYMDFWEVAGEIHLINIATHPEWRRRGIGRQLMDFMIRYAARHKDSFVTLDVRPSNIAAIELYRTFGFQQVGLRKRYYQDNDENALVLSLRL